MPRALLKGKKRRNRKPCGNDHDWSYPGGGPEGWYTTMEGIYRRSCNRCGLAQIKVNEDGPIYE